MHHYLGLAVSLYDIFYSKTFMNLVAYILICTEFLNSTMRFLVCMLSGVLQWIILISSIIWQVKEYWIFQILGAQGQVPTTGIINKNLLSVNIVFVVFWTTVGCFSCRLFVDAEMDCWWQVYKSDLSHWKNSFDYWSQHWHWQDMARYGSLRYEAPFRTTSHLSTVPFVMVCM